MIVAVEVLAGMTATGAGLLLFECRTDGDSSVGAMLSGLALEIQR